MAKYITLVNWTDQGIKNIKDSPKRLDAAREMAKKHGVEMRKFYMTIGQADMVAIIEARDDEAMAKFALALGSSGNVRTTTMKAFSEDAYRKIVSSM